MHLNGVRRKTTFFARSTARVLLVRSDRQSSFRRPSQRLLVAARARVTTSGLPLSRVACCCLCLPTVQHAVSAPPASSSTRSTPCSLRPSFGSAIVPSGLRSRRCFRQQPGGLRGPLIIAGLVWLRQPQLDLFFFLRSLAASLLSRSLSTRLLRLAAWQPLGLQPAGSSIAARSSRSLSTRRCGPAAPAISHPADSIKRSLSSRPLFRDFSEECRSFSFFRRKIDHDPRIGIRPAHKPRQCILPKCT